MLSYDTFDVFKENQRGGWKEKTPAETLSPSYNFQFSHCKLYLEIFLGEGLSLIFSISKLFSSSYSRFIQIQELLNLVQKLNPTSHTCYAISNAKDCMSTMFYNRTRIYVSMKFNNYFILIFNYKVHHTY